MHVPKGPADEHSSPRFLNPRPIKTRILNPEFHRRANQLSSPIKGYNVRSFKNFLSIEFRDLARHFAVQSGSVKQLDLFDSRVSLDEIGPKIILTCAYRRNDAQSGYDNTLRHRVYLHFRSASTAQFPPKANELFKMASASWSRATFGT